MNTRHALVYTTLGSITLSARDNAIADLYFRYHIRRPPVKSDAARARGARQGERRMVVPANLTKYSPSPYSMG